MPLAASELILNADGSIYHLNLLPEDIATTIITVGDPDRVGDVSKYFDEVELKKGKREFQTHTGVLKQKTDYRNLNGNWNGQRGHCFERIGCVGEYRL